MSDCNEGLNCLWRKNKLMFEFSNICDNGDSKAGVYVGYEDRH